MARIVAERQDVVPLLAEVFRAYGYEGASLARITEATGLGKGSLYHFFPGGKKDMAAAVLAHIDDWFLRNVHTPLRQAPGPHDALAYMFDAVDRYFLSGRKICLVGAFALGNERDRFAQAISAYFHDWMDALAAVFENAGVAPEDAAGMAEDVLGGIQGALVLARARNDSQVFTRILRAMRLRVFSALPTARKDAAAPP